MAVDERERGSVNEQLRPALDRRNVLRMLAIGAAGAAAGTDASAQASKFPDRHKAHYQADSPNVQTFYRVNRYPAK